MSTVYWSPNQTAVAQVETYTFTAPNSVGNTYTATINGKTVTYTSVSGDTAATVATALFNKLNVSTNVPPEITEITFTNPSDGVIVATASTPGVPFANVTINGVSGQGLVLSTGNGLANGITTAHTTANSSPNDVYDSQNWLIYNTSVTPPTSIRGLPVDGDDVVVSNSSTSLLWNLDRLRLVKFNTYTRNQSFTATIGLSKINSVGYDEWRATHFKFSGPDGSVPAGGLHMLLGYGFGSGPGRENYDVGSSPCTLTVLATGSPIEDYTIQFIGYHTANTFSISGGASMSVASLSNQKSNLTSSTINPGCFVSIGPNVTWTSGSTLSVNGGQVVINSAPNTLSLLNNAQAFLTTTNLTWPTITAKNGSTLSVICGGTITNLTLTLGSTLNKSQDSRALTITNSTMDGDTCTILDPLNSITFTNATTVNQTVSSGPIQFTGTRTVKVT